MKNLIWLWSIACFILLFSWVMVGQNPPPANPFGNAITAASGAPLGINVDSVGSVYIGAFGTLGLNEIGSGNAWIGSNVTPNGGSFKYKTTGAAAILQFNAGKMLFRTFVSGSAGATATPKTSLSIDNASPDSSVAINSTGAVVAAFGVQVATVAATPEPTCAVGVRGTFWVVQGGAGVKDQVSVCAKDATDAYAWRTIF